MPKITEVKKDKICIFCKTDNDDEFNYGILRKIKNLSAHHFCLLLSETIQQSGTDNQGFMGFMHGDILKEMRFSKLKQCNYCKKFEASLGCSYKGCYRKYHLNCAIENNVKRNFENFTSLCHTHGNLINIPENLRENIEKYHCMICFEDFPKSIDLKTILWSECCKGNLIFHHSCLKQMASSAGYFTKCPGCNNKELFVKLLKTNGIFVPERDASWEESRNAFGELRYVHKMCDTHDCKCPKGRNYSHAGKWKLSVCTLCGSYGTHYECFPHEGEYVCPICSGSTEENKVLVKIEATETDSYLTSDLNNTDTAVNNIEVPHCSKSDEYDDAVEDTKNLKRKLLNGENNGMCNNLKIRKLTHNELKLKDNMNAEFEFVNFTHQDIQPEPFVCNLKTGNVPSITKPEEANFFCIFG